MKKEMLVGDNAFYKKLFMIAVPMMIQMGITNFAGMLDNIMVGRVGNDEMTGVAIANQLIFVFNIMIFGAVSGPGLFTAQFVGDGNEKGVRYTVRVKLMISLIMTIIAIAIFVPAGETLISLFIEKGSDPIVAADTLKYGDKYLSIIVLSFIPFALTQVYAGTLKEMGETVVPMIAGVVSVVVNTFFNYVLIYGKLGAPKLGIEGAAIATVMARIVEFLIVLAWTHTHAERYGFIKGLYKGFKVPVDLFRDIVKKGIPLLLNEALWATGMAVLLQCYSLRGIEVVTAMNITNTLNNIFNVVFISIGNSIGIIVGQYLGMGDMDNARKSASRIIFTSTIVCVGVGVIIAATSFVFPELYKVTAETKELAGTFLRVIAVLIPVQGFLHSTYFTIRTGGKTGITFLFDCGFMWCVAIPFSYILSRFTSIPIVPLYIIISSIDIVKAIIGFMLVKKGIWLNNMVKDKAQ